MDADQQLFNQITNLIQEKNYYKQENQKILNELHQMQLYCSQCQQQLNDVSKQLETTVRQGRELECRYMEKEKQIQQMNNYIFHLERNESRNMQPHL